MGINIFERTVFKEYNIQEVSKLGYFFYLKYILLQDNIFKDLQMATIKKIETNDFQNYLSIVRIT